MYNNQLNNRLKFSVLNSFSELILVLDYNGKIVYTNSSLNNYNDKKYLIPSNIRIGSDYLELCRIHSKSSLDAAHILSGAQDVLNGVKQFFSFEYSIKANRTGIHFNVKIKPLSDDTNYFLVIISDITQSKNLKQKLADYTESYAILFKNNSCPIIILNAETGKILDVNSAACDFYGYSLSSLKSMDIFQICSQEDKKIIHEKHFEQVHRLSSGELVEVEIESLSMIYREKNAYSMTIHDISEKHRVKRYLKDYKEKFNRLADISTDAVFIINTEKLVFANKSGLRMLGIKTIYELLDIDFHKIVDCEIVENRKFCKLIQNITLNGYCVQNSQHKIIKPNGKVIYIEINAAPITYKGTQFIEMVVRDITKSKKELERAYTIKRQYISFQFPIHGLTNMESIYTPAKSLSGDYFKIIKVDETTAVGMIGDVSGKDIIAALNTSALNVLFNDSVSISNDPLKIIKYINSQMLRYFNEEYIAVCCFLFDFKNMQLKLAGAGINQIVYLKNGHEWFVEEVKGSFLGMFEETLSEEITIDFSHGDKFFFYTDGMDFLLEDNTVKANILKLISLHEIKDYLNDLLMREQTLKDDCSWFGIEIN